MYLTYLSNANGFTKDELRCLSSALGFHEDIFTKNLPKLQSAGEKAFVDTKVLYGLVENKVFNTDLHKTFNFHVGVYNVEVLRKAIHVLANKVLSFEDLKNLRIAFDLYEFDDLTGLETNPGKVLAVLKMADFVVSPKFLTDHLKHTSRSSVDRLTFYEFLDLVELCEKIGEVKKRLKPRQKSSSSVSEIVDFLDVLSREDIRILEYLDEKYQESIFRAPFTPKITWRIPPKNIIANKEWREQVSSNRKTALEIDSIVNKSNKKVSRLKNGCVDSPTPFIDVNMSNSGEEILDTRNLEEIKTDTDLKEMTEKNLQVNSRSIKGQGEINNVSCKYNFEPIVENKDIKETQTKIIELLWQQEVKNMLTERDIAEQKFLNDAKQVQNDNEREENLLQKHDVVNKITDTKDDQSVLEESPCRSQSTLYSFLRSRSKQRDSILSRDSRPEEHSVTTTQRSQTQPEGTQRRIRNNHDQTQRHFLPTR